MTRVAPARVVLMPGMLERAALWAGQVGRLAGVAGPVQHAALDRPTVTGMAAEVLALSPGALVLIGHSLGGIVAMAAARRAPERIAGLALLSTNARAPRPDQHAAWQAQERRTRAGEFDQVVGELMPALLSPAHLTDPALRSQVVAMAADTGPQRFFRQLQAQHSRIDERPWLRSLRCPVLVIAAENDALCPYGRHEEIADLVPHARLEVVPDSGHISPIEQPGAVADLLTSWLAEMHRPTRAAAPH